MQTEPTLENTKPPAPMPVPPPPAAKKAKGQNGNKPPTIPQVPAAPKQAASMEPPPPQAPPEAKPKNEALKSVVDRAAVALIIGGIEEQLLEWFPIVEQHILNTGGEKGCSVSLKVSIEPDAEMGLRCRVGSSFSGTSLKQTWRAQIREAKKDGPRQLALFTA